MPPECAKQLSRAFELYWTDKAAAANRLRFFVECLMDHFNVPTKGKGQKKESHVLDLFERIVASDIVIPSHKDALEAMRHVGNNGSHGG